MDEKDQGLHEGAERSEESSEQPSAQVPGRDLPPEEDSAGISATLRVPTPTSDDAASQAPSGDGASQVPDVPAATDGEASGIPAPLTSDYDGGDDSTTTTTFDGPDFRVSKLDENRIGGHVIHRRPKQKHGHNLHLAAVGAVLAVVAAIAIGAGVTYNLEYWGGKTVPSVVGLNEETATERISEKGLTVEVETVPADTGSGRVISVEPSVGTRVEEGSTVAITVGVDRVIPQVVGLTSDEARAALEQEGASNVQFVYERSDQPEGTVLSVDPAEGAIFLSSDQVTLTVAMPPKVPDLVGRTEKEALMILDDAGLTPEVTYVATGSQPVGDVMATDPVAGERTGSDGVVRLTVVSPQPTDPWDVRGYFDATSTALLSYLQDAGYTISTGSIDDSGKLHESFVGADGTSVSLSPTPWHGPDAQDPSSVADHLSTGAKLDSVRVTLPTSKVPQQDANADTASQVESLCGLGGATAHCDETNITLPGGTTPSTLTFYCEYGEEAGYGWTVFVYKAADGATQAIVSCAPKSVYASADVSQTGGKIADFTAWSEIYDAPTEEVAAAANTKSEAEQTAEATATEDEKSE